MRRRLIYVLAWIGICALAPSAFAHHTAGHGGGGSALSPFSGSSRPPKTFLDLSFTADALDLERGEAFTYQLAGEYAFHRRLAVGARVPFLTLNQGLSSSTGLGDVALTLKGLIWRDEARDLSLNLGSEVSFPTGDESEGFGSGTVSFFPYLNVSKHFSFFDAFLTGGGTLEAATPEGRGSSFDYAAGVSFPVLKRSLPLDLFLAFQGSSFLGSDTFTDGSTKGYLKPGIAFHFGKHLVAAVSGKISVIDTLRLKRGVVLTPTSPAFQTDVEAGFASNLYYSF